MVTCNEHLIMMMGWIKCGCSVLVLNVKVIICELFNNIFDNMISSLKLAFDPLLQLLGCTSSALMLGNQLCCSTYVADVEQN